MRLEKLLEGLEYQCLQGSADIEIREVANDSRQAGEGSLFICIKGAVTDGHQYVPQVVQAGVKALVVQERVEAPADVTVIQVRIRGMPWH